ncbi:MAG TPA: hypothetical protein VMF14_07515 [Solirubrobacteraceae bacterium]|nr:hypothetical protein [Solirubrobacteraceae bacterium]
MTDAVVISGAAAVPAGGAPPVPLLSVGEDVELAIGDRGTGSELVVHNPSGAPLRLAVEGVGDITIPPGGSTAVAVPAEPDEPRLHLQALSPARSRVVMASVGVESSDDGPIAVAQAIGADTC